MSKKKLAAALSLTAFRYSPLQTNVVCVRCLHTQLLPKPQQKKETSTVTLRKKDYAQNPNQITTFIMQNECTHWDMHRHMRAQNHEDTLACCGVHPHMKKRKSQ